MLLVGVTFPIRNEEVSSVYISSKVSQMSRLEGNGRLEMI